MAVCRPAAGNVKSTGGVLKTEGINEQNFPCHLQPGNPILGGSI